MKWIKWRNCNRIWSSMDINYRSNLTYSIVQLRQVSRSVYTFIILPNGNYRKVYLLEKFLQVNFLIACWFPVSLVSLEKVSFSSFHRIPTFRLLLHAAVSDVWIVRATKVYWFSKSFAICIPFTFWLFLSSLKIYSRATNRNAMWNNNW